MSRLPAILMLLASPLLACAQDSAQVARLEQEVRQLQREVVVLSQLVTQLRAQADRPATVAAPALVSPPAARTPPQLNVDAGQARWLDAQRWRRLRTGMSELEVIGELGPATSMRGDDSERVLFYALEIGASGFLAGSVTLRDRVVAEIETPHLK